MSTTLVHRKKQSFLINPYAIEDIKLKVLHWLRQCNTFSFLDNNQYQIDPHRYELLVGVDVVSRPIITNIDKLNDWVFGQLDFEFDFQILADTHFIFIPKTVIYIDTHQPEYWTIESVDEPELIYQQIIQQQYHPTPRSYNLKHWTWHTPHDKYMQTINAIRQDIYNGQYYEINYCVKCSHQHVDLDAIEVFIQQKKDNPSPFAALMRMGREYIICSSPERFLYKNDQTLICQPIKGTIKRHHDSLEKDEELKSQLFNSEKDRAENVMIVDLTRNDLYRCCQSHTVEVPELFGIYTFPFVHQMISTISGQLQHDMTWTNIFQYCYPMGSMTGAPKKTVVEHIVRYESEVRGHYSGTIFYINPRGDFDSNVVIRSLFYNEEQQELSFYTGGAITYDSTAEGEWEEILVKSQSMRNI